MLLETSYYRDDISYNNLFLICIKAVEKLFPEVSLDSKILEIAVVTPDTIQQLNHESRGKNTVTDVLSFPFEGAPEASQAPLGEIVICEDRAREQAEYLGHCLAYEIVVLTIHGLLHILGYDHIEDEEYSIMSELEKKALQSILSTQDICAMIE